MKSHQEECVKLEALLDDYVDGVLDEPRAERVELHLTACAACRHEVEALRSLLAASAGLPRSLDPERDLWPQIAGQLVPRTVVAQPGFGGRMSWWLQAAAAVLLVLFGAFLGRFAPGSPSPSEETPARGEIHLASFEDRSVSEGFGLAEAEFLRAKETLWLLALRRQDELSPVTRKVVERNLRILDKAIFELRTALENDPGNPELEHLLLNHHRRGVDLLERLARTEV